MSTVDLPPYPYINTKYPCTVILARLMPSGPISFLAICSVLRISGSTGLLTTNLGELGVEKTSSNTLRPLTVLSGVYSSAPKDAGNPILYSLVGSIKNTKVLYTYHSRWQHVSQVSEGPTIYPSLYTRST